MPVYDNFETLVDDRASFADPVYLSEKQDIIEYYRERYPDAWKKEISKEFARVSNERFPGKRPLSEKNASRNFDGDRIDKVPGNKHKAIYKEIGENLPPVSYDVPENGYQIDFEGYVKISEECDFREFDDRISGADAYGLINDPSFAGFMALYFPDGLVQEPCGEWKITIEPLY